MQRRGNEGQQTAVKNVFVKVGVGCNNLNSPSCLHLQGSLMLKAPGGCSFIFKLECDRFGLYMMVGWDMNEIIKQTRKRLTSPRAPTQRLHARAPACWTEPHVHTRY